MRMRRLVTLMMGGWLGASLLMNWIAVGTGGIVDSVLATPSSLAQEQIKATGVEQARILFQFQSSEQLRIYVQSWESFQLVAGAVTILLLLFATNGEKLAVGASAGMVVIVMLLHWTVTPQLIELGRSMDFATAEQLVPERTAYYNLQRTYSVLEIAKIVLGLMVAMRLTISTREVRRKRKVRAEAVHKTGHGSA